MFSKTIIYEEDRKIKTSQGMTFDEILEKMSSMYINDTSIPDPRSWSIDNDIEKEFSIRFSKMSLAELDQELRECIEKDNTVAQSLIKKPSTHSSLLQDFINNTENKPISFLQEIRLPINRIYHARDSLLYFKKRNFLDKELEQTLKEFELFGYRLKALIREICLRWSR